MVKIRYLSNIKDIENYDSETDKIEAFKSSHKTIYSAVITR